MRPLLPDCARADLDRLRRTLLATDDALDDVTRARVLARLGPTIDEVAAREPRLQVNRLAALLPLAAAAAALLLLVAGLVGGPNRSSERPRGAAATDHRILLPFAVNRPTAWREAEQVLGRRVGRLDVPAGIEVRALLGEQVALALVGPARIEVVRAEPGDLAVQLDHGTLVASYEHGRGGRLEVHSPGVITEVVGTLFMVEVEHGQTGVAVAHGKIRVRGPGGTRVVGRMQSWKLGARLQEVSTRQARLLRRFEGQIDDAPVRAPSRRRRRLFRSPARRTIADTTPDTTPDTLPAVDMLPPGIDAGVSPAAPAAPDVERQTASGLYGQAEQAMRSGDFAAARRRLEQLVQQFGADPLAAQARYDLAHLALGANALDLALAQLNALATSGAGGRLTEPANYLRCRVELRRGDGGRAAACLERFRARYPHSPHDAAALAHLVVLRRGDCRRATALAAEFLARHGGQPFAASARRLLESCRATR